MTDEKTATPPQQHNPLPPPPNTPAPPTDTMPPADTPVPTPTTPRRAPQGPSTPIPATPSSLRHAPPSATATPGPSTPFPPRTPHTPSSSLGIVCTMDATLYRIVKVHTAKCTECDKRNKAVMRRCPGCTFQVCTPCFERRKKNGKGLRHGMSMSSSASPLTVRAAQRKIDVGGGGEVPRMEELKKKEVGSEGDKGGVVGESGKAGESVGGGETVSVGVQKEKVKVVVTPKPKPKRRAIKKQKKTAKFVESEDDLSSELSDPEDYASPTPSKRRRSTLTVDSAPTVVGPPQSEGKKRFVPLSTSRSSAPTTSSAAAPSSSTLESALPAPDKTAKTMEPSRTPVSKLGINELMHVYGVNTAENPYHEHLLSRREPVVSNPNIRIPDRIARGFKPRRTAEDIHKDIQEKVRKKLEEGVWGKPANAQEASTSYYHDHCVSEATTRRKTEY
ncbi:hypothetical protein NX059_011369 [Plenodomus lindquistii]|nr:hypothetical protein NX059_011369 [Plenodomus lindquistii]